MTYFRRILTLTACVLGLAAAPAAEKNGRPSYAGWIVTDAASGRVLFEENADVSNPPASMAKLMTFAVLHDRLASGALTLQTPVRITAGDSKMGGTQVFLDPRETFPVEELVYAMMIQSANDAAHALARAAAGSVEAFVELMNAKARELGMTHTTFRTPHGLPPSSRRLADGDLTTPRDFARLCRHLVTHTDVLKYTAIRTRDFGAERKTGPQHMQNHNNLLGRVAGVDGLKTGYTMGAGYCLSATAERHGRRVIAVIMGAFGPNGQVDKGKARDLKAVELIERGFAAGPADSMDIPTVKTDRAAPAEQNSTAAAPAFTFRVTPPPPNKP
ncbi:MAG: D-alanyl-D-alanine carboxypeptidase [Opitutae bacterium]|nr:D-alanyl-D-alanine carboxypeptidase [Opitutae bacterium]